MSDHSRKRLNWREACILLRCGKDRFYALIRDGILPAWHIEGTKGSIWVYEDDCLKLITAVSTAKRNSICF